MSARPAAVDFRCRLEQPPCERMFEFAAFAFPLGGAFVAGWPTAPGAVRHDVAGRPVLLHFAPARWLAPAPQADVTALLEMAIRAGAGAVVDVAGKWQVLELLGPGATRLLASTVDVEAVLERRECAAVTLFDCPAVLARLPDGFVVWVKASYAADFVAAVERLRSRRGD